MRCLCIVCIYATICSTATAVYPHNASSVGQPSLTQYIYSQHQVQPKSLAFDEFFRRIKRLLPRSAIFHIGHHVGWINKTREGLYWNFGCTTPRNTCFCNSSTPHHIHGWYCSQLTAVFLRVDKPLGSNRKAFGLGEADKAGPFYDEFLIPRKKY